MMAGKSIFERLAKGRPPVEQTIKEPQQIKHAQKVLEWLLRWNKPIVCAQDIRLYGPRPRNRKTAIELAKILAERGWLQPIPTHRYDRHAWQIIRKPIINPTVANGAD